MNKLALALVLAAMASPAYAATAYFTGRMEFVTTVTYQSGVRCQYDYLGTKIWRVFVGSTCPQTIEVE